MPNPIYGGHHGPPSGLPIPAQALALSLCGRGISCIACNGKRPVPGINWSEYKAKPPSPSDIERWWKAAPTANAAILCGTSSKLTVVDVDGCGHTGDALQRALNLFGTSPLVVETPGKGGGYQIYYRHNGEALKPYDLEGLKGEIRGNGGYVMSPGSFHVEAQDYYRTGGDLEWFMKRLDEVQPMQLQTALKGSSSPALSPHEGSRNNWLFYQGLPLAKSENRWEDFVSKVIRLNQTAIPPLDEEEAMRVAGSVWSYKERNSIFLPGDGLFATIRLEEWQRLDANSLYLLTFLRAKSGHRQDSFAIGQHAVGKQCRWSKRRLAVAIKDLIAAKIIHMTYKGGKGPKDPSQYAWGAKPT